MKKAHSTIGFTIGLVLLVGCGGGKKVMVPPNVDLEAYRTIGLVQFTSNAEGDLDRLASQKFIQAVQSSQPRVRVLELGNQEEVLRAVRADAMNHETIRALGEKYRIDALIVGNMDVTDVTPKVEVFSLSGVGMQADVEATLTTRLYETPTGATAWTRSASCNETVAHVGLSKSGPVSFGASDPEDAYGKLIGRLVYQVTQDFRVSYVRQ